LVWVAKSLFQIHNSTLGGYAMPLFQIRRRVDAYIDYVATVGGSDAREAAEFAQDNEDRFVWEAEGQCEFDARIFIALDAEGCEIEESQCGDL